MHTYQRDDDSWSVGYWRGDIWQRVAQAETRQEAAALVSYLNGGEHPSKPWAGTVLSRELSQ